MLVGGLCLQQPLKNQLVKTPWSLLPDQGDDVRWQTLQAHVSLKGISRMLLHWVPTPTVPTPSTPHFPAPSEKAALLVLLSLGEGRALTATS